MIFAIVKWDVDIEKGYGCEGIVAGEFYGGENVIEKGSKRVKVLYWSCPYHEDVAYVTHPWLERGTW